MGLGDSKLFLFILPGPNSGVVLRSNLDSQQLTHDYKISIHLAGVLPWLIPPIFGLV